MKELILIRHAKSSWEFNVPDIERPIKPRGYKDIHLVSESFRSINYKPDLIACSPAQRTRQTAKIFINEGLKGDYKVKIVDQLYDFSGGNVLKFVKSLSNDYQKVIIFGHNHAFTSISNIFGSTYIDNLPTSGLVHMKFDISKWGHMQKGETVLTIFPRDLKNDKR